jgi:hypothetical protein
MNRKPKILLFSTVLIAVAVGTAFAAIHYTQTIPSSGNVLPSWFITLWRTDTSQAVLSLNFSDIQPGTSKSTADIFAGDVLRIKNLHCTLPCYCAWELDPLTPLPYGITLSALDESSPGVWTDWTQNYYGSIYILPNSLSDRRIEFLLTSNSTATVGPFSFNILLHAADSGTG